MSVTITEYQNLGRDAKGETILAGQEPSLAVQVLEFGETSALFNGRTTFIRVAPDMPCRFRVGKDQGFSGTPVSGEEYFGVVANMSITVWGVDE